MTARNYALDPNAAREANTGGKRIQETGKYIGNIVAGFYECNQNGTESLNIMFRSDQGQEAGPLTIYTHNGAGEALAGYKLVNAIMTCCKVKSLTPRALPVQLYDHDQQAVVTKTKECYTELMGKRIGFVLQQEEYEKQRSEGTGTRMVIFAPFEAESERMAAEVLDKKAEPEQLGHVMAWIAKNPIRFQKKKAATSANQASQDFQSPPDNFADWG